MSEEELVVELDNLLKKWAETMERNRQYDLQHNEPAIGIMAGAQAGQILDLHTLLSNYRQSNS